MAIDNYYLQRTEADSGEQSLEIKEEAREETVRPSGWEERLRLFETGLEKGNQRLLSDFM